MSKRSVSTQKLFNDMRKKQIVFDANETLYIDLINRYLINMGILTQTQLIELNRSVIAYLTSHPNKSYVEVMKKSKTLNGKVDWAEIETHYQKILKEYEEITNGNNDC